MLAHKTIAESEKSRSWEGIRSTFHEKNFLQAICTMGLLECILAYIRWKMPRKSEYGLGIMRGIVVIEIEIQSLVTYGTRSPHVLQQSVHPALHTILSMPLIICADLQQLHARHQQLAEERLTG